MKQTICDVCGKPVIKESPIDLRVDTKNKTFLDICQNCSKKIYKTLIDIKDAPISACPTCGTMER